MARFVVQLNKAFATELAPAVPIEGESGFYPAIYDWIPALKAAAMEVQALNQYAGSDSFPRAIPSNPEAMVWVPESEQLIEGVAVEAHWEGLVEGFIGDLNTPPTADGMVFIDIQTYEWINLAYLPAQPTTFSFIVGTPKHAGTII